jgi:uncharacterized protein (DUF1697 family)
MTTWIAFFRGINVGGNNPLPMKTLPALFGKCGCAAAKTYIQSGNVVFRSSVSRAQMLADRIGKAVKDAHGFQPSVFVLSDRELARAMKGNPYPAEAEKTPQWVHLFFLAEVPKKPDWSRLEAVQANGEQFALQGRVFYLHTPAGFGTSKLAGMVGRALGVDMTARNWRTCQQVLTMARELE